MRGFYEMTALLLERGADPALQTSEPTTSVFPYPPMPITIPALQLNGQALMATVKSQH